MENTQELNEQSVSELQLLDVFYNIMAFIPYLSEDYLNCSSLSLSVYLS